MSYTPTTWQNGDVITAEKLNHMEDGIAEGGGGSDYLLEIIMDFNDESGFEIIGPAFDDILDEVIDGTATARLKNIDGTICDYADCIGMRGDDDPSNKIVCFYFLAVGSDTTISYELRTDYGMIYAGENIPFSYTYADGVYTCTFTSTN